MLTTRTAIVTGLRVSDGRFPEVFTTVSVTGSGVGGVPAAGVMVVSPPVLSDTIGDGAGDV